MSLELMVYLPNCFIGVQQIANTNGDGGLKLITVGMNIGIMKRTKHL